MFKHLLSHHQLGAQGEKLACQFLKKQGLSIVMRNYRCRYGEIDIIATDQSVLVFVEVKLRKQKAMVSAAEAIGSEKLQKIQITAQHYLQQYKKIPDCRIDALLITGDLNDYAIEWLKSIT